MRVKKIVLAVALIAAVGAQTGTALAEPDTVRIRDLGTLPGGTSSSVGAINDDGVIVGSADVGDRKSHATRWDRSGRITDLGTLAGYESSYATRINNRGVIVGYAATSREEHVRAVRWDRFGRLTELKPLPGDADSKPFGLNADGEVVGISGGGRGYRAVRWNRDGAVTELEGLGGDSWASAINDDGVVAGYSRRANELVSHVIRWAADGRSTDLTPNAEYSGRAEDINDAGTVVGVASPNAMRWDSDGKSTNLGEGQTATQINNRGTIIGYASAYPYRAGMWNSRGEYKALPGLPGEGDFLTAFGINDRDVIVGGSGLRAVRWDRDGRATDLGTLPGGSSSRALIINNAGVIAGDAYDTVSGGYHAVVWR
ncbi:hypothetical protein [Amycolatopsis sp. NPDC059657]|uniref:hypothetical protein n=1 Tax=Amycolatopsis sp. NPDC059657 TaxID=3346899 RepID=UPI0036712DD2